MLNKSGTENQNPIDGEGGEKEKQSHKQKPLRQKVIKQSLGWVFPRVELSMKIILKYIPIDVSTHGLILFQ